MKKWRKIVFSFSSPGRPPLHRVGGPVPQALLPVRPGGWRAGQNRVVVCDGVGARRGVAHLHAAAERRQGGLCHAESAGKSRETLIKKVGGNRAGEIEGGVGASAR